MSNLQPCIYSVNLDDTDIAIFFTYFYLLFLYRNYNFARDFIQIWFQCVFSFYLYIYFFFYIVVRFCSNKFTWNIIFSFFCTEKCKNCFYSKNMKIASGWKINRANKCSLVYSVLFLQICQIRSHLMELYFWTKQRMFSISSKF